jgi:hypothetical protein
MASGWPQSVDSFTNPLTTSALNSPSHAGQHQDLNDAVNKIEANLTPKNAYDGAFRTLNSGGARFDPTGTALSVTLTTGTRALVMMQMLATHSVDNAGVGATVAVSGATTISGTTASATWQAYATVAGANGYASLSPIFLVYGLTAGSNTFTANHYYNGSGTAQYGYRQIMVFPLP